MKKIPLLLLIPLFIFSSCNNDEVKRLKDENKRLYEEIDSRDKTVNDMFKSLNEIEQNLYEIRAKEMIIKNASSTEIPADDSDVRERITQEMQLINELVEKNKKQMDQLKKQMKNSNIKIVELEKTIDKLNRQIEERDTQIADLKTRLETLNFTVEELNTQISGLAEEKAAQSEIIEKQTEEINSGWFVFGTKNELIEKNIISRKGGIIGIGKTSKISADMNLEYFTKIDIRKTTEIPLMVKDAKVLSTHPADSYELKMSDKTAERLIIKDQKKFWSITKYLIIETK
ncbi:MAG: hypothetical protein RBS19_09285 [Bacteroidales bacterium]|nr:hypothetical protein [Bacteroidales bacterium]MDY0217136.1 hypothetical protein [Bacteroidales bacterium]